LLKKSDYCKTLLYLTLVCSGHFGSRGLLPGGLDGRLRSRSKVAKSRRGRSSSVSSRSFLLGGSLRLGLLSLLVLLIRVTIEEQIDHDVPRLIALELALDAEDLTGKKPVHQTDRGAALVVARDGNIDVAERAVSAAKSDDGKVAVRGLRNSLVIHARVGHDEKTRLTETLLNLVGESTRGETTSNCLNAEVPGKLEDSALTIGTLR